MCWLRKSCQQYNVRPCPNRERRQHHTQSLVYVTTDAFMQAKHTAVTAAATQAQTTCGARQMRPEPIARPVRVSHALSSGPQLRRLCATAAAPHSNAAVPQIALGRGAGAALSHRRSVPLKASAAVAATATSDATDAGSEFARRVTYRGLDSLWTTQELPRVLSLGGKCTDRDLIVTRGAWEWVQGVPGGPCVLQGRLE